jgi:hypothetical protein
MITASIFTHKLVIHCVYLTNSGVWVLQTSSSPYYTFYYDTMYCDGEEIEERALRHTVNTEDLMAYYHHSQPDLNNSTAVSMETSAPSATTLIWLEPPLYHDVYIADTIIMVAAGIAGPHWPMCLGLTFNIGCLFLF